MLIRTDIEQNDVMGILRKIYINLWYLFGNPPWDTNISPPELMEFIENQIPGRALDLGCGTGTNAITLAQNGWKVIGVDFASIAIKSARRKAKQAQVNIDFYVEDVVLLEGIHGPFDLILDIGCFHNLDDSQMQTYITNLEHLLGIEGTYLLYAIFRSPENSGYFGLEQTALHLFHPKLKLIRRKDGMNFDERSSAWLWFKKPHQKSN